MRRSSNLMMVVMVRTLESCWQAPSSKIGGRGSDRDVYACLDNAGGVVASVDDDGSEDGDSTLGIVR